MDVEGYLCEIILMVRKQPGERNGIKFFAIDYTFIWEAIDLKRQPLRVAYHQTNRILTVVDYKNIQVTDIDPSLLEVPDDYLSFTPF